MTIGAAMTRFYVEFLAVFATSNALFLSLGILMGCWIGVAWQKRRARSRPLGIGSWDSSGWVEGSGAVFEPGVAQVTSE